MIQQLAPPTKRLAANSSRWPATAIAPQPRPRTSIANSFLRLVRKVHLYSGLFLFPWVLLYGVTGYLFNHPRSFSDQAEVKFGVAEIEGTLLKDLPKPPALASQVVAAIALAQEQQGRTEKVRLIKPESARFGRGQALVSASAGAKRYSVMVDLDGGPGSVRTREEPSRSEPAAAPFADRDLRLGDDLGERLRGGVASVLDKLQLPVDEVASAAIPDLLFQVEADGKPFQVAYSPDRGSLVARPAGQPLNTITTRSFLTRLHLIHGYPTSLTARWFWAAAVDVMFVAMCFWGLSGILMWWQLKATRLLGASFLVASVVVATSMTIGMHREMQATPPSSRGAEGGPKAGGPRHHRSEPPTRSERPNPKHAPA